MKRLLVVLLAVVVGLVFVGSLYAQTTTEQATKPATGKMEAPAMSGKPATKEVTAGPCMQIVTACKNAGFIYGAYKKGDGLYYDCIDPIMQGKTRVPGATKPLPAVDSKLIAECKKKDPAFGTGEVGYKPTP
jgi:hypothetical protein